MSARLRLLLVALAALLLAACAGAPLRGTGDLGLVIERASGHVTLVNTSSREAYARIGGLGPALLPATLAEKPAEGLVATIMGGRPGTAMPPWHRFLGEDDAQWIVARLMEGFPK